MVEFYPYAYVRTIVMRSKLLSRDDYETMIKMGPEEIINFLQNKGYREFSRFGAELKGIELVERSVKENMVSSFDKLRRISTPEIRELVDVYLMRYDVRNIKAVLRGISLGENTLNLVIPAGKFNYDFYEKMYNTNDVKKALSMLKGTIFASVSGKTIYEIESLLDKAYYDYLISFEPMRGFYDEEIIVKNILVVLKLMKNGIEVNASDYQFPIVKKLIKQGVDVLKTAYGNYVKNGIEEYKKSKNLIELEKEFRMYLSKRLRIFSHKNLLSINTILSFMFEKEIEIKNILLIYKTKAFNMKNDVIKENLIV